MTAAERAKQVATEFVKWVASGTPMDDLAVEHLTLKFEQVLEQERKLALKEAETIVTGFYDSELATRSSGSDLNYYAHDHAGAVLTKVEKALRTAAAK